MPKKEKEIKKCQNNSAKNCLAKKLSEKFLKQKCWRISVKKISKNVKKIRQKILSKESQKKFNKKMYKRIWQKNLKKITEKLKNSVKNLSGKTLFGKLSIRFSVKTNLSQRFCRESKNCQE